MNKIMLLVLLLSIISCTGNLNEENLVGKWSVIDFDSNGDLSPHLIQSAKEIATTGKYEFFENGAFEYADSYLEEEMKGNWKLLDEAKQLELTYQDASQAPKRFSITSSSKNKMVLIEKIVGLTTNRYTLRLN